MNKLFLLLSFSCVSLSAMKLNLPSGDPNLTKSEAVYYRELENSLIDYFHNTFCIDFVDSHPDDPVITPFINRLIETVVNRTLLLQNPQTKKKFCKLYANPKTVLNALDLTTHVDKKIAQEALRSVLADRRLITNIVRGTYDQPWLVRPEFDQIWSTLREEIREINEIKRTATRREICGCGPNRIVSKLKPQSVPPKLSTSDSSSDSSDSESSSDLDVPLTYTPAYHTLSYPLYYYNGCDGIEPS